MFKPQDPNTLKVLETIFKKNFPDKSFSNLVQRKVEKNKVIYKDSTDNKYYGLAFLGKTEWREITNYDIIRSLN